MFGNLRAVNLKKVFQRRMQLFFPLHSAVFPFVYPAKIHNLFRLHDNLSGGYILINGKGIQKAVQASLLSD